MSSAEKPGSPPAGARPHAPEPGLSPRSAGPAEASPARPVDARPPARPSRALRFLGRFVVAHFAAYAYAFAAAVAAMPLAIHLSYAEIEAQLGPGADMDAIGRWVALRTALPAAIAFALPHLAVLPWAFGFERAKRPYLAVLAALALVLALVGAGSWIWLFTL